MWGRKNRRVTSQVSLGIKGDPISTITSTESAGGATQVLEDLQSKREEALSSTSSTEKEGGGGGGKRGRGGRGGEGGKENNEEKVLFPSAERGVRIPGSRHLYSRVV
jgi:hypothetical protein